MNYRLANDGRYLRNTYQAHEIPGDESGLAEWFAMSRFATDEHPSGGASYWLDHIHGLEACVGTWCARKPTCDGIYLRRTHPVDLAGFLVDYDYPGPLRDFVNDNVERLDHLRFEQGFDFTVDDDEVTVLKTAFYGYF